MGWLTYPTSQRTLNGAESKEDLQEILAEFFRTINGLTEISRVQKVLAGHSGGRIGPYLSQEGIRPVYDAETVKLLVDSRERSLFGGAGV